MQHLPTVLAVAFCFVVFLVAVVRAPRRPSVVHSTALVRASMQRTFEGRLLWDAAVSLERARTRLEGKARDRVEAIMRIACRSVPLQDAMAAQLFVIMVEKAKIEVGGGPAMAHLEAALRHAEDLARVMSAKTLQRAKEAPRVA